MRKLIAALAALVVMCGPAFGQVTGGAPGPFAGPEYVPLTSALNADGSSVAATAAAGTDFVIAIVADTTMALKAHSATSNTKTDTVIFEIPFPIWKSFGDTLTIQVNTEYAASMAPSATALMQAKLQSLLGSPAIGSALTRLSGPAFGNINTALTGLSWTFDTSAISPGVTLLLTLTTTVVESDGGTAQAQIDGMALN